MKYEHIVSGKFISRPNRFIAHVLIDGHEEIVHVKNTGRCRELLDGEPSVYLSVSSNPARKTKFDLIAVLKKTKSGTILINMDSQVVNDVAEEYLRAQFPQAKIKREVTFGNSRFDFYIEDAKSRTFCEVKGVTLENDGVVSFPDAPTERGVKHLKELISAKSCGYDAMVLFVVQMEKAKYLTPNDKTHKEVGDTLRKAKESGVLIKAISSVVSPDTIIPNKELEVRL